MAFTASDIQIKSETGKAAFVLSVPSNEQDRQAYFRASGASAYYNKFNTQSTNARLLRIVVECGSEGTTTVSGDVAVKLTPPTTKINTGSFTPTISGSAYTYKLSEVTGFSALDAYTYLVSSSGTLKAPITELDARTGSLEINSGETRVLVDYFGKEIALTSGPAVQPAVLCGPTPLPAGDSTAVSNAAEIISFIDSKLSSVTVVQAGPDTCGTNGGVLRQGYEFTVSEPLDLSIAHSEKRGWRRIFLSITSQEKGQFDYKFVPASAKTGFTGGIVLNDQNILDKKDSNGEYRLLLSTPTVGESAFKGVTLSRGDYRVCFRGDLVYDSSNKLIADSGKPVFQIQADGVCSLDEKHWYGIVAERDGAQTKKSYFYCKKTGTTPTTCTTILLASESPATEIVISALTATEPAIPTRVA